jgi:copper oxidase (laccase) domain-containing protein
MPAGAVQWQEKMVDLFQNSYGLEASEREVALGASIGACCYEVKDDVAGPLLKRWGDIAKVSIQTGKSPHHL